MVASLLPPDRAVTYPQLTQCQCLITSASLEALPRLPQLGPDFGDLTISGLESGGFPGFGSPKTRVVPTCPLDRAGVAADAALTFGRRKRRFEDSEGVLLHQLDTTLPKQPMPRISA